MYKKLEKVSPETDYGYTVVGADSFVHNRKRYSLKKLVNDKYKKNFSYISELKTFGDSLYFLGVYDSRKNSHWDTGDYWTYDVAIFRLDWNTLQIAEEVYDFKNITSIYKDSGYDSNPDFGDIISYDRAVMRYNGALHILDLQQKEVIYSVDVSAKLAERKYSGHNLNNGDFYIHTGDYLYYYEYEKDCFALHEYESTKNFSSIERLENYVYTYSYDTYDHTKKVYRDCFNLTTDESVTAEDIKTLDTQKESEQALNNKFVLQGNTYSIKLGTEGLEILSDTKTVTIDEAFMLEHSQKFVELYDFWIKNHSVYKLVDWTVTEEKIFVGFSADYGFGSKTPTYIYEYDPLTESVYYVGFSTSRSLCSFWLNK
ncbi:MAG: hypothetical protein ACI4MQ_05500 [Candidatus Coproplasma sp.]